MLHISHIFKVARKEYEHHKAHYVLIVHINTHSINKHSYKYIQCILKYSGAIDIHEKKIICFYSLKVQTEKFASGLFITFSPKLNTIAATDVLA